MPPLYEPDEFDSDIMVRRPLDLVKEEMEVYDEQKSQALREGDPT